MFTGAIEGVGPRYCPSVEDKIVRFADKSSHQIFVEPEGLTTDVVYPNGISTSLPYETQVEFVRSIPGFESAVITQPGYAIEYDYFDPRDLEPTLETRPLEGLYFAGQINGTTGYEEAGAQGLIAGLNAARRAMELETWFPQRHEGYIGVLIDDLITRGVSEPYRMFTSRAEYRLTLREDNADQRLSPIGRKFGLVGDKRWLAFNTKMEAVEAEQARLAAIRLRPEGVTAAELLKRPENRYRTVVELPEVGEMSSELDAELCEQVETQVEVQAKYAGYISRQEREIAKHSKQESLRLPGDIDYADVDGLSNEARQRLQMARPVTLGHASRLEGITPSAISLLLIHLKKRQLRKTA
jgi:tRNA uridine 5-carboxymethylaminomethyl modification enzyme